MAEVVVEREIQIAAKPATVFTYLTDSEKIVTWMGKQATVDARPGAVFRLRYEEGYLASGEYVEVVQNERVVLTWGWEAEGAETPPGASTVEITLTPDGDGTRLRLVHRGLSEAEARTHGEGWDHFLARLAEAAA